MRRKRNILQLMLFLLVLMVTDNPVPIAQTQESPWDDPTQFFNVETGGNVQSPVLVTDSGGNVYAFWSAALSEDESMSLYMSTWQGNRWTLAKDVLISPDGGNTWPHRVFVDNDDNVHVFWLGQDNVHIWHYSAHSSELGNPYRWIQHNTIVVEDVAFGNLGVDTDGQGIWHLVYGNRDLDRILYRISEDDGNTWSDERTVHLEFSPDTWVGNPGVVIAPDGSLRVSWQQMEEGTGRSIGLQYSIQEKSVESWSAPEQFADGYYFGGFSVQDDLMIRTVGGGIGTGGRYISFSTDSGSTWTVPKNISAGAGEGSQYIPRVVDSEGNIHFVVETGSAFARVEWNGRFWAEPDFVASREQMADCCITPGKVTENAAAAISGGNLMHVFFEEDNRVLWYTNRHLAASELEAREIDAPPIVSEVEVIEERSVDETALESIDNNAPDPVYDFSRQAEPEKSTILPLLLPIAVVSILLIAVFLWLNPRRSAR